MGWVTIKGKHVLIDEAGADVTGGGHRGAHDAAKSTGNVVSDRAVKPKRMSTLDRIRRDKRVEDLSLDDPYGPILTLKKGWSFDPLADNRVIGEDTPSALLKTLRRARRYAGPYEK